MESVFIMLISALFVVVAKESAIVGNSFHYVIDRRKFAFDNLESSNPITFRPALDGKAGLPSLLKYYQEDTQFDGYLYGTPQLGDVGITNIEIIALNRATYKTARVELLISVEETTDSSSYRTVFNVTNKNLIELLSISEQNTFLEKTRVIWPTAINLVIYSIIDPGKRTPSLEHQDQNKGVIVTVASSSSFSDKLINEYNISDCDNAGNNTDTLAHPWNQIYAPEFVIDWCYVKLVIVEEAAEKITPLNLGGDFEAPEYTSGRIKDIRQSFYMIVVLPIAVAFLVTCLLGYLMFCRREGVVKRNVNTPEEQLIYHKNIKKSTKDLRKMNNRRKNPGTVSHPNSPNSVYQTRFRSNRPSSEEEPLTSSPAANPEASPPVYRLLPLPPAETSFMHI
ncbi:epsilon-sarcoglycan-like isoform X2 [Antedon mediterranea]|uniref:epsilon-sarcoglycan-like isoform X2 n=1 Tax=Antedon mediterranea TaxID=105859 RepID=UPI003AF60A4B